MTRFFDPPPILALFSVERRVRTAEQLRSRGLEIAAPVSDDLMSNRHLLQGFHFGSLQLSNRVVLAPLTRGRSGDSRVPNGVNAEYYAQRASAGLIITEAAAISKQGYGWAGAPGMYSDEQQVSSVSVHHFKLHYAACCCITESDGE